MTKIEQIEKLTTNKENTIQAPTNQSIKEHISSMLTTTNQEALKHIHTIKEQDETYTIYETNKNKAYLFFKPYIIDDFMKERLEEIINSPFAKDCEIAFMPDTHPTSSCMVGTTIQLKDKVDCNYVSSDIGCGVSYLKLSRKLDVTDFKKIDEALVVNDVDKLLQTSLKATFNQYKDLICFKEININLANRGLGTVGGGNHFIEIARGEDGFDYLVVHSGSRNLGGQVHKYYEKIQKRNSNTVGLPPKNVIKEVAGVLARYGLQRSTGKVLDVLIKELKDDAENNKSSYLAGQDFKNYLHDLQVVNEYAKLNRKTIMEIVLKAVGLENDLKDDNIKMSVHNIIGKDLVFRKGTIEAVAGQEVIIPINMAYGSIIGIAKGLPHWNNSCPHGAGRVFSRTKTKNNFTLAEFKQATRHLYSSTVTMDTIDESPMAYKDVKEILETTSNITITNHLKAIYNFKTASKSQVEFFKELKAKKKALKQKELEMLVQLEEEKEESNNKKTNSNTNISNKSSSSSSLKR